jgi:hypothetical protein
MMSRATERISPLQATWTATIQGDRIRILLPSLTTGRGASHEIVNVALAEGRLTTGAD